MSSDKNPEKEEHSSFSNPCYVQVR